MEHVNKEPAATVSPFFPKESSDANLRKAVKHFMTDFHGWDKKDKYYDSYHGYDMDFEDVLETALEKLDEYFENIKPCDKKYIFTITMEQEIEITANSLDDAEYALDEHIAEEVVPDIYSGDFDRDLNVFATRKAQGLPEYGEIK